MMASYAVRFRAAVAMTRATSATCTVTRGSSRAPSVAMDTGPRHQRTLGAGGERVQGRPQGEAQAQPAHQHPGVRAVRQGRVVAGQLSQGQLGAVCHAVHQHAAIDGDEELPVAPP